MLATRDELLYTAGLFDGEGCIHIARHDAWKNAKQSIYTMQVSINNTDKDIIDWLKLTYGGCKYEKNSVAYVNRKHLYHWSVNANNAEEFLTLLYPYLRIKKERCKLALEYRSTFGAWRPSKETLQKRELCLQKMHQLNKKGCRI